MSGWQVWPPSRRSRRRAVTTAIYDSDLTNAQWAYLQPMLAKPRKRDRLPIQAAGLLLLLLLLSQPTVTGGAATNAPKHVLLLESFNCDMAPWDKITPTFITELAEESSRPVKFHEVNLDTSLATDPQSEAAITNYLLAQYAGRPPDLVVPVGAEAARFWWRYRQSLFPSTPVVIAGIEDRILQTPHLNSNETAVTVQIGIARTCFDPIFELFPATTNVVMVIGNSTLERFWLAECQRTWTALNHSGHLVPLNTLSFPEICRRVATLPPRSVLAYWIFWVDAAGVPHEQTRALDRIFAVANAPVFGVFEDQLGHGIIGGRLISSESIGQEAGRLAARVLGGEPAGKIPPVVLKPGPATFDWRQLQRWHVSESQLPPGSIVRFRRPSTWERYHWVIVGALGIMILEAATIMGLLLQRTRRRRAEATALNLAGQLITDREDERRRIAGELHDQLGQDLLVITSQAQLSLGQLANPPATVAGLNEIAQTAKQALQQTRRMVHNLRPGLLDELGFTKAIRACADKAAHASGFSLAVNLAEVEGLLPDAFEVNLFRIVQEALNNVLKHARASAVKVTLSMERARIRLLVEDNGCGFDLSRLPSAAPGQRGIGLREIAERAKIMGGRADIQSRPDHGTRLIVDVPCSNLKPQASPTNCSPT